MPTQPDIVIFMSDQHTAGIMGCAGDEYVSTPNLDRIAAEGTRFDNAYTSCPLCVPARMSFLSGQLPSRTGIFNNSHILSSEQATIPYALGAAGYETVLVGRMHFKGPDQRHGFERRLVGDFTPLYDGRGGPLRDDLGPYANTPAGGFDKLYGGGTSPVLEYDRAVLAGALALLEEPHERPLFVVVGNYGPHHTYVAPPDLYRKYLDLLPPPRSDAREPYDLHPTLGERDFDPEVVKCMRAAYYGQVEHVDGIVGRVAEAFDAHLARAGREGVFCYLSDHGDQIGEKKQWGKMTFYEESAAIPLMFRGPGVRAGRVIDAPVSIMDLAPTVCEMAGAPALPEQDGVSLVDVLGGGEADAQRAVFSELIRGGVAARMARRLNWKYASFGGREGEDVLTDLANDEGEYRNCRDAHPDVASSLREVLNEGWDPDAVVAEHKRRSAHLKILAAWGAHVPVPEPERWKVPESSWETPTP